MGMRELNVDLTDEHITLREAARKFLEEVWRPASISLDKLSDETAFRVASEAIQIHGGYGLCKDSYHPNPLLRGGRVGRG